MTSNFTAFMGKFGGNLEEDVAGHRDTKPASGSPIEGRSRMKNAARLRLDVIDVDPQHREEFDEEGLQQLSASLQEHGQLQPIRVRYCDDRGRYILIAGERRLRAMKLAGWEEADAVIADGELSQKDILLQQAVENLQREDLKPCERANLFSDMITKFGWDQKQLAVELKVSEGTVSNALKLLKLDSETQAKIDAGELKATVAISTARKSRKPAAKKSRKPKPMTIRAVSGKIVIEPKMGKTYEAVLVEALEAVRSDMNKAA